MRAKLSLKTLYRSPVRMVLTFILLVAVTFTLFSQVLEHAVTVREINKSAEQYDGVGAVEVSPARPTSFGFHYAAGSDYAFLDDRIEDPFSWTYLATHVQQYEHLTQEQIDAVTELPYVTSVDTRYMTAGVSNEFVRMDDGDCFYNHTYQCIMEGTLVSCEIDYEDYEIKSYSMKFTDCKHASEVEPDELMGYITVEADSNMGGSYGVRGTRMMTSKKAESKINNEEFINSLEVGRRYAFVARYEPITATIYDLPHAYDLSDSIIETWSNTVWDITDAPDNWIETEEYAEAKKVQEMINLNYHTFDMVYTDDMGSIMRFANGNMAIVDGRSIGPNDSTTNPNVCVVSREFAQENGLNVGDTITMQLGDKLFEQYGSLGAVPLVPARASDNYTQTELEIVGIYANIDAESDRVKEPNWVYSYNAIFLPKALLNVSEEELENHSFAPGEFSFKIENAWDIPAFLEAADSVIKPSIIGASLIFEDQGWPDIMDGFESAKQLGFIRIGVLSAAVLVATWFVAMLYITGRKKDYAVMRVLGTDTGKANKAMLLPFMVLSTIAVIVSAVCAFIYTQDNIAESNALVVLSEFVIDTSISPWIVCLSAAAAIVLAFVIAYLMLHRLGKRSPLELIQDNQTKKRKQKEKVIAAPETAVIINTYSNIVANNFTKYKKYARHFTWKYIFRHIRRTVPKALLTVLLAALLLNVVGQLNIMRDSYAYLVEHTEVTSNFIGGIPLASIDKLEESGYAKSIYYAADKSLDVNNSQTQLVITNNVERYCGDAEINITYGAGYDEKCFDKRQNVIILNNSTAEMFGLTYGDSVIVTPFKYMESMQSGYIMRHREKYPDDTRTDEEIFALYLEEAVDTYSKKAVEFVIAGTFEVISQEDIGSFDNTAFTPGSHMFNTDFGKLTTLDIAEATVADNNLVDEYREFGEKLAGGSVTEGVMFVMDTSKLENLRNTLRLVEMLYPIAVVVTLVIGAFLCGLIIVQTSKDIAIMRVLGTSKAKTCTILVLEQMILCIFGIIIAGIILYIRGAILQTLWVLCVYALVILLASIIAASMASLKNVLELLQTKE